MRHFLQAIAGLFAGIILLLSVPAQSDAHTVDSLRVQALLAEGDVFYHRLDNRLAIATYLKAFALDSISFDVLSRLARTATDLGRDLQANNQNQEARDVFLNAVRYAEIMERQHAENPRTHFFLALTKGSLALFQGGGQKVSFGRDVEIHCQKALELDSTDAEILVAYGVFNREVASSTWMERAIAKALFGRIPEGNKEESVRLLMRAVELAPDLHIAHFELALSLIAVGRTEEAIYHLKLAQSLPAQTTQDNRNRQLAKRMLDRMKQ